MHDPEFDPSAPPDLDMQRAENISAYARTGRIPWRRLADGRVAEIRARDLVAEQPTRFPLRATARVSLRRFEQTLARRFRAFLIDNATTRLARTRPDASAARLFTPSQKATAAVLALAGALSFALEPLATLIAVNIAATAYFVLVIGFRLWLIAAAQGPAPGSMPPRSTPPPLADADLPIVTVLLPVHREAKGLAPLSVAIGALDYPTEKLDVKLIVEDSDAATIAEARRLRLNEIYDIVVVPQAAPQTKPKACNYALPLARGALVVIYDAEDAPERDQVRKAAAMFAAGDARLACVQARLNYFNADENWLSRLFALEYALWFDTLLPTLEKLNLPIPLGGTSNFLRTQTLIEIGGWDPYNVTEDADLGLRLAGLGYQTAILDSTTYEEANCRTGNWIRQRSRWMKGYMQTWLVHMRRPRAFAAATGWRGLAAAQLFIGGNVFSALINPFLWAVFLYWLTTRSSAVAEMFPGPLLAINLAALVLGNCFFIYLAAIAPLKRGWLELSPFAILAPAYWALTSVAAYRALWQLFTRPHYWEKTDHMLSPQALERREDALQAVRSKAA